MDENNYNWSDQPTTTEVVGAEEKKPAGFAIAALVFGILSIIFLCIPVVPLLTALIGVILGGIGVNKVGKGTAGGKGMAITGLVMSIVCMVIGFITTFFLGSILVPSMMGYVKKSNQAAVNTAAKNIFDSAATSWVDYDSMGYELPMFAIFCSDYTRDYGSYDGTAEEFKEQMSYYYDSLSDYEYYVLIEYGSVTEVVCYEKTDSSCIGRYPSAIQIGESYSFDDLYFSALQELP